MEKLLDQPGTISFLYESDAAASFLVIQCQEKVIEYQLLMLEQNRINNVISPDMVRKDGMSCFYYNITSKISLAFLLKRRKLSREEFLKVLVRISSSVSESSGYLLNISGFIFNAEYIYINPETLEPSLIYVPAAILGNDCETLQDFASELLMQHIHSEGFDNGNLVQRILSAVRSEVFTLKGFIAILNELLYGTRQNSAEVRSVDSDSNEAAGDAINIKNKKEDKKEEKQNKVIRNKPVSHITIMAVLLQFAMGIIIYLCRDLLNNAGDSPAATYAAVAMIVLAVDVLLFRKITAARLINVSGGTAAAAVDADNMRAHLKEIAVKTCGTEGKVKEPDREENGTDVNSADSMVISADSMAISAESCAGKYAVCKTGYQTAAEGALLTKPVDISCKTELLGSIKGVFLLRSTGRHGNDGDILIDKDDFIIGRLSGHVDYVVNNNAVGKLHAELIRKNGCCFVRDLNSVNGTFINNRRIESNKEFELKENDRLQLANCEYVLAFV